MDGGKLLATGSSSCIFRPNIPCKGDKKEGTDDKISKIVYGKKSDRYLKQEKKLNGIIQTIKGYEKWALIYDNFCYRYWVLSTVPFKWNTWHRSIFLFHSSSALTCK